jgi:hypothetical protein
MRIHALLPTLALAGVLATSAFAQADDLFPPVNAGCGAYGMAMSQNRPTVRVTSLRLRDTGQVRIGVRGNQTAATKVRIAQDGGRRVGGTPADGYTCTRPDVNTTSRISVPLNAYGRKLVRRHGRLPVKVTFRLINGSGVTNTRVVSGVITPE